MITWVRIERSIGDDPKVYQLAERTGLDVDAALGKLVRLFAAMAEKAKDGDLTTVPDQALEDWVRWRGRRGRFATAVRELFTEQGIVTAWERLNGAAIAKAERDAARIARERANRRANRGKESRDCRATDREPSRDDRASARAVVRDETRRDVTTELPTSTSSAAAAARARLVEQLPEAAEPELDALLGRVPAAQHRSWLASLDAMLSGQQPLGAGFPNAVPPTVLADALRDFNANGETNLSRLRGYCRGLIRAAEAPPARQTTNGAGVAVGAPAARATSNDFARIAAAYAAEVPHE